MSGSCQTQGAPCSLLCLWITSHCSRSSGLLTAALGWEVTAITCQCWEGSTGEEGPAGGSAECPSCSPNSREGTGPPRQTMGTKGCSKIPAERWLLNLHLQCLKAWRGMGFSKGGS